MINPEDYLALVKSFIALCPEIITFQILREEILGNKGLWRYRLTLKNNSFLEMFEFFEVQLTEINIIKYSFHWQTKEGKLIKRWDNAPHHPEIETFPHHLHDDTEDSVFPYTPISLEEILRLISAQISSS